jgi:hypothetical protein
MQVDDLLEAAHCTSVGDSTVAPPLSSVAHSCNTSSRWPHGHRRSLLTLSVADLLRDAIPQRLLPPASTHHLRILVWR